MRAPSLLLILLPLLAVALAPVASADHAYSHRYLVFGRVVDGSGHPLGNVNVSSALSGAAAEGPCANQPGTSTQALGPMQTKPVTDVAGNFMFCYHLHALARGTQSLTLRATALGENVTAQAPLDPLFRASYVVLRLNATATATPAIGIPHVVAARLWREAPGAVTVEGVRVYGTTLNNVPVNVTVEHPDGTLRANGTTNNYGDVALSFPELLLPNKEGRVTVEAQGRTYNATLAPEGITYLKIDVNASAPAPATPTGGSPAPESPDPATPPATGGLPEGPTPTPGGGTTNETPLPLAALLGALLVALALRRRR